MLSTPGSIETLVMKGTVAGRERRWGRQTVVFSCKRCASKRSRIWDGGEG